MSVCSSATCTCTHAHTHTYTHTLARAHTHTHAHTHVHAYMPATYTHVHTHIHTHTCLPAPHPPTDTAPTCSSPSRCSSARLLATRMPWLSMMSPPSISFRLFSRSVTPVDTCAAGWGRDGGWRLTWHLRIPRHLFQAAAAAALVLPTTEAGKGCTRRPLLGKA